MKTIAASVCLLAVFLAPDDQAAMQGNWTVLEYDQGGKQPDAGLIQRMQMTIKGDKLTIRPRLVVEYKPIFKDGKANKEVAFSADPAKADEIKIRLNPAKGWIDLGDDKPTKGVYLLEDGVLKICFAGAGKNRPKKFPEQPKNGMVRMVLKKAEK